MTIRSDVADTACSFRRDSGNPEAGVWRLEVLTDREREVLLLLGAGLGNRELSRALGIAERTVKAHIANIVAKLGQQTRTQAAIISALAHNALCTDPACSQHLGKVPGRWCEPTVA